MENVNELSFEIDCLYSKDHTWVKKKNDHVIIGISDYAQEQLGEIIFIQLPESGDSFMQDKEFGFVESAKSVSELYAPLAGEVIFINSELEDTPEKINEDPFGAAWMIKIIPDEFKDLERLMTAEKYKKYIGI